MYEGLIYLLKLIKLYFIFVWCRVIMFDECIIIYIVCIYLCYNILYIYNIGLVKLFLGMIMGDCYVWYEDWIVWIFGMYGKFLECYFVKILVIFIIVNCFLGFGML